MSALLRDGGNDVSRSAEKNAWTRMDWPRLFAELSFEAIFCALLVCDTWPEKQGDPSGSVDHDVQRRINIHIHIQYSVEGVLQ